MLLIHPEYFFERVTQLKTPTNIIYEICYARGKSLPRQKTIRQRKPRKCAISASLVIIYSFITE